MATETVPGPQTSTTERRRASGPQFLHVARFELLRQFRRRRLLVLLIISALLLTLLIVVLQVFGTGGGNVYSYASSYGTWVTILAALAATFFGADALVGEFEHQTGYLLFPQPVTRASIFLGKLLSAFALTGITMGTYFAVVAAATGIARGSVPVEIGYSFLLAVLYSTAALGVAFFLSALLRSTTMASVMTFAILFFVLSIVSTILTFASVRPDGNLAFAGGTISNILSGPYPGGYPGDSTVPFGPGGRFVSYSPAVPISIAVMTIWAVVGFALALLLYRRREMKG